MKFPKKISFIIPLFLLLSGCDLINKGKTSVDVFTPPEPVKVERALNIKEKIALLDGVAEKLNGLSSLAVKIEQTEFEGEMSESFLVDGEIKFFTGGDYEGEVLVSQVMKAPLGEISEEMTMTVCLFSDDEHVYTILGENEDYRFQAVAKPEEGLNTVEEMAYPPLLNIEETILLGEDGNYYVINIETDARYYWIDSINCKHTVEKRNEYLKIKANYEVDRLYVLYEEFQLVTTSTNTPALSDMALVDTVKTNYAYTYGKLNAMKNKANKIATFPKLYINTIDAPYSVWGAGVDDESGQPIIVGEAPTKWGSLASNDDYVLKRLTNSKGEGELHIYYSGFYLGLNNALTLTGQGEIRNSFADGPEEYVLTPLTAVVDEELGLTLIEKDDQQFLAYLSAEEDPDEYIFIDIEIVLKLSLTIDDENVNPVWNITTVKVTPTRHLGIL